MEQKLNTLYKEEQKIQTALRGEKPNNRLRFIREIEKCKSISEKGSIYNYKQTFTKDDIKNIDTGTEEYQNAF